MEGFASYNSGGIIFGGVFTWRGFTWRGLFLEFYSIFQQGQEVN